MAHIRGQPSKNRKNSLGVAFLKRTHQSQTEVTASANEDWPTYFLFKSQRDVRKETCIRSSPFCDVAKARFNSVQGRKSVSNNLYGFGQANVFAASGKDFGDTTSILLRVSVKEDGRDR